jgi:hypothetical protein
MKNLITRPVKRFFAFGCSFTEYHWTTWPEIVAEDLGIDEYYNFGKIGGGNEFIFNRLMQADQVFHFNENDLVIVCWTNSCREDRYTNGKWILPGNIYTQDEYSKDFIKKYYINPEESLLHDFAYIKASRTLLEHKNTQWHFLQMLDLLKFPNQWETDIKMSAGFANLFEKEKLFLNPSFYEVLWENDLDNKFHLERKRFKYIDYHPNPKEHFEYLKGVFINDWKQTTSSKLDVIETNYIETFSKLTSVHDYDFVEFKHLKESLTTNKIY